MKTYYKLHALKVASRDNQLSKDELFYINQAYASYKNRLHAINYQIKQEDVAPIVEKKLAALKEIKCNDVKSCIGIDYGVDELTAAYVGKTFRGDFKPLYTQAQFIQSLGRVHRNPNQTKTMNEENLLPFDLDVAIKHPERVYNVASGTQNIKSISVLASGNIAAEYHESIGGSGGYIYTREIAEKFLRIVAPEPALVPWTLETVPNDVWNLVFRHKESCSLYKILSVSPSGVRFCERAPYWESLSENYEWSYNSNGPWNPCGVKS